MVGLSIVLEARNCSDFVQKKTPQVVNKANLMMNKPPSSPSSASLASFRVPDFLEHCFLCRRDLSPGKDIYMYKGDRAFCSEECRCRQILLDEEELLMNDNCYVAAKTASSHSSRCRKSSRNRAGGFAY